VKCTLAAWTLDGSGFAATASMYTAPVNQSLGPGVVSIEFFVICISLLSFDDSAARHEPEGCGPSFRAGDPAERVL
jgi:hypothetical protein